MLVVVLVAYSCLRCSPDGNVVVAEYSPAVLMVTHKLDDSKYRFRVCLKLNHKPV